MQHVCDPDWREAPEKEFNIPGEITEPLCACFVLQECERRRNKPIVLVDSPHVQFYLHEVA